MSTVQWRAPERSIIILSVHLALDHGTRERGHQQMDAQGLVVASAKAPGLQNDDIVPKLECDVGWIGRDCRMSTIILPFRNAINVLLTLCSLDTIICKPCR